MCPIQEPRQLFALALKVVATATAGLLMLEIYCFAASVVGYRAEERVERKARDYEELAALGDAHHQRESCGFEILVLGDSMAFSPGVTYDDLWSTLMEGELRDRTGRCVRVVNAATPGGNTLKQLNLARRTLEHWQPDLVLQMYNYNDITGKRNTPDKVESASNTVATDSSASTDNVQRPLLASFIRVLYSAKSLHLIVVRTGLQLKSWGIVVPGSEFSQLVREGYTDESPGWSAVRDEIRQLHSLSTTHGVALAVYVLPQMDTLRHDHFVEPRRRVDEFLVQERIPHAFGWSHFRDRDWKDLAMSPFDGHPNSHANQEIAAAIVEWLGSSGLVAELDPLPSQSLP